MKCCVPSCEDKYSVRFRFPNPKDSEMFKLWLVSINNPLLNSLSYDEIYKKYRVCAKHFPEEDLTPGCRKGVLRDCFYVLCSRHDTMDFLVGFIGAIVLLVIVNKFWCFWCRSKVCLLGKTAIVTGAASGLGFQIAIALAAKGCRVIAADVANLSQAVEEIKKLSHNSHIIGIKVDLQSLKSVRAFAKEILDSEPKVDILICNAGIPDSRQRTITEDGLERTMQVNYFSHFLLTHLLLDLLKKSSPSRIIFTSSQMAYFSDVRVDMLNPSSGYYKRLWSKLAGGTYSNSKLCMAGAAKLFGDKLKGTGVTANANLVGGVKTQIFWKAVNNDRNYLALVLLGLTYLVGKTPEEGAQTLIHLAHSDELNDVTGQLFMEGMVFSGPGKLTDEFCKKLWDASIEFTKLQPHEIKC